MVRYAKPAAVQMQETAEAIGWLKQQTGGLPQLKDERYL